MKKTFAQTFYPVMITIRDVAAKAEVSITTVSHVLNDTRPVSDELRQRVLAAVEALDYKPNQLARSLRLKQTKTIGMMIPDNSNPFFSEIAKQIEKQFFNYGYSVILCNTDSNFEKEQFYAEVLIEKQVDGIIYAAATSDTSILSEIQQRNIPVVVIDRIMPGLEIDTILVDNQQGGKLAAQHLIELGHHRIGCISSNSDIHPGHARTSGYCDALRENNIEIDQNLIRRGEFKVETGYIETRLLLGMQNHPSALFCGNDLIAIGAIHAAREMGVKVPEELSVIGFDDIPMAKYFSPALSTIAQPFEKLGKITRETLFERSQHMDLPIQNHILGVSLVIRDSTTTFTKG